MPDEESRAAEGSAFELGTDGPRSILVGVDGSDASVRAGAYAAGLARRQGSRLIVVHARMLGAGAGTAYDTAGAAALARLEELDRVEASLHEALDRFTWELDSHVVVRSGPALRVITEVAEETRTEAVVVGSSRSSAFLRPGGPLPVQLVRLRRWPVVVVP